MPFLNHKTSNNAQGQLLAGISASAGTLILQSGQGTLFPAAPFRVKLEKYDTAANGYRVLKREICLVTAVSSDTLTITRSYENCPSSYSAIDQTSTAFSFDSGDTVSLVLTAGQIEDIQDEVARLENAKLDDGTLRTGLTAKRVMVTDASGNEAQLSGTSGQAVGFDVDGNPVALTPSANINGLAAVTSLASNDEFVLYSALNSANRKIASSDLETEMSKGFFGTGADGSLSVTSWTTSLTATGGYVIKQYENLSVSGGTLDVQGEFNILYVRGTFTMSGWAISANGRGGAGWNGVTSNWAGGTGTKGKDLFVIDRFNNGSWAVNASQTGGAGGTSISNFPVSAAGGIIRVSSGSGGGGANSTHSSYSGGNGGAGGGVIIIVANKINFTSGTISVNGNNWTNGNGAGGYGSGGGGGGGGGGTLVLLTKTFVANSGTKTANGGNGGVGDWQGPSGGGGGGGGGGYAAAGGNGGNGGNGSGTSGGTGGTNAYSSGGTGGTSTNGRGGGGGGGAAGLVYSQTVTI